MLKERAKGKDTNRTRQKRKTKQKRRPPRRHTKTRSKAYPRPTKSPTPGKSCAKPPQLAASSFNLECHIGCRNIERSSLYQTHPKLLQGDNSSSLTCWLTLKSPYWHSEY